MVADGFDFTEGTQWVDDEEVRAENHSSASHAANSIPQPVVSETTYSAVDP